jgi:hypothetical protein
MGNSIAPHKLDGFQKSMDNIHSLSLKRFQYQNVYWMHRAPMSPSEPAGPFLKLLFRLMKTTLVRKKTQLNDKMTKSKIWQIQKRFVILSFILKRSCYFWRFLEKFSDFLCSNFGTLTTTSKIQMKYVWWQNRMTKWHFFALNPITRMFEMI